MKKYIYLIFTALCLLTCLENVEAGNPDRQGEAGAYELLMNPWARSAGLHSINTASITGVEAMRLNVAGTARINKTEVVIGHARYLEGSDLKMNAIGIAQKIGESGTLGVSIMSISFGDIAETTTFQPEGTGTNFSPSFFNIGVSYAQSFDEKISVGILVRAISENIANVGAFGMVLDAGVQYVTGPQNNFKLGISLRNIGSKMSFKGDGLNNLTEYEFESASFQNSTGTLVAPFEVPSMLNIGLAYDFVLSDKAKLTAMGNFTSNSFSEDYLSGGLEFSFSDMIVLRGAYRYESGSDPVEGTNNSVYTGISGGISLQAPVKKGSQSKFGIDYAYRATNPWNGTHNIGLRFGF